MQVAYCLSDQGDRYVLTHYQPRADSWMSLGRGPWTTMKHSTTKWARGPASRGQRNALSIKILLEEIQKFLQDKIRCIPMATLIQPKETLMKLLVQIR